MKIKDVKYVPYSQTWLWEKVDDITRYLRLSAEFGCSEEGKEILDNFVESINKTIEEYQTLVLEQKDADEPDDLENIKALRKFFEFERRVLSLK